MEALREQGLHPGTIHQDEVNRYMRSIERHPRTEAGRSLRRLGMAPEDVAGILAEDDPEMVRHRLELHRELLVERLDEELSTIDRIERVLTAGVSASDGRSGGVA